MYPLTIKLCGWLYFPTPDGYLCHPCSPSGLLSPSKAAPFFGVALAHLPWSLPMLSIRLFPLMSCQLISFSSSFRDIWSSFQCTASQQDFFFLLHLPNTQLLLIVTVLLFIKVMIRNILVYLHIWGYRIWGYTFEDTGSTLRRVIIHTS